MRTLAFIYHAVLHRWGKNWELLQDNCQTAALQYPASEEEGKFGQMCDEAKELVNAKWPEKDTEEDEFFIVAMAGRMCFYEYGTEYGVEHDMRIEVQWSDVSTAGTGDMEVINSQWPDHEASSVQLETKDG